MLALIMAGGSGKRFWPLSTKNKPKQFLAVENENSMLYNTYKRLINTGLYTNKTIFVVTASSQASLVKQHLPMLEDKNIISEPKARNTAAAIALSVAYFKHLGYANDTNILVLPADHIIKELDKFTIAIKTAITASKQNYLCTFGIKPNYPATGYGYIQAGGNIFENTKKIDRFKEKPDLKTAESFLAEGNFYWNSGIFLWSLKSIYNAFEKHFYTAFLAINNLVSAFKNNISIEQIYDEIEKKPIDIGIMEKAENGAVVFVDYYWNDVGSFNAIFDISKKDENNNAFSQKVYAIESKNNYVKSQKNVALIGVDEMVIIETETTIMVVPKNKTEEIKKMYEYLEENNINIT